MSTTGRTRQIALIEHRDDDRGVVRGRLLGVIADGALDTRA
jgi:hypothetical protein